MKKIAVVLVLLVSFVLIGCGSKGKNSEMKSFHNDSIEVLETQTKALKNAKDVDDVVVAFDSFQKKMLFLQKKAQELEKKYPDFEKTADKSDMKDVEDRLNKASAAYGQAVMSIMMKYKDDPKFKKAMMDMKDSMSVIK